MKKLEILVVEDSIRHLNDAKNYFEGKDVAVDYATSLLEAEQMMDAKTYDGVISDIFFPAVNEINTEEDCIACYRLRAELIDLVYATIDRRYISSQAGPVRKDSRYEDAMDEWVNEDSLPPAGLCVIDKAIKRKIKIVITTDSEHHGFKCQPIMSFAKELDIPFISTDGSEREKDWNLAYNSIKDDAVNIEDRAKSYDYIKKIEIEMGSEEYMNDLDNEIQELERRIELESAEKI